MRFQLVVWLLLSLLVGCASTPPTPIGYGSIEERQRALRAVDVWTATGRIALSTPSEGFSAAMDWRQVREDYDVMLTALLGQRALRVSQQGALATLQAPGRAMTSGSNAEQLMLRELGVRVPLSQMRFWIRGLPGTAGVPGYDNAGRLQRLAYNDADGTQWVADFKSYQRVGDIELPALINISGRDYSIRLLVKNWQMASASGAVSQPGSTQKPAAQPTGTPGRLQIPNA